MPVQPLTPEDEERKALADKLGEIDFSDTSSPILILNRDELEKLADFIIERDKQRDQQKELELLDFAVDVVEQFAYEPEDGKLTSGGLSTLERAFSILRRNGKLNKKGQYVPGEKR